MKNKTKYLVSFFLALAGCTLISVGGRIKAPHVPKNRTEYANASVMIVNEKMNSGGSGVIIDSRPGASHILTNKHVCQLIQTGGLVVTDDNTTYPVDGFRVYSKHDLCLIEVMYDLHVNIKVANQAPNVYEKSIIVGHPTLLPTIFSVGHFSQRKEIAVMVDIQPCDGTEKGDDAFACFWMGGRPVIKNFQSQVTSSLIMPGSSGSPVYNSKGELAALVFAGSQGLSYGFLVPWEYVHDFLKNKEDYKLQTPDPTKAPKSFFASYFKFEKLCNDKTTVVLDQLCKSVAHLGIWNE